MNILIIADNIGLGGKERRMLELVKSLCKDPTNKITLLALMDRGVGYQYIYDLPITVIESHRKSKFSFQPFIIYRDAVKKYKPDVVHSWGSTSSLFFLPNLFFRKFKFINGIIADAPKTIKWYEKIYFRGMLTFPFSDVVIGNSLAGLKSYDAPKHKSVCIYNGIDMARFENLKNPGELRKELGIEGFNFVVGMVGAFMERKDYDTMVKAAKKILQSHKNICFLLVGEGHMLEEIKAMVTEEEKNNILFLGKRPDVEDLIQVFDVGVLCTNTDVHGEGVSNSIIEYMSLKKPVIATEGGGTNEVIVDNENGYLIQQKAVDSLVEKILFLYQHPDASKQMGENALATIKQKFMLDRMTEEFIKVYKN